MKSVLVFLAVCAVPVLSMASSKWSGSGEAFSPDGKSQGAYQIEVVNTDVSANIVQSKTAITFADGSQENFQQMITSKGTSWTVESDFGKGGGTCYGQDICENYIQNADGLAIATTIVKDGETQRRDLTVILSKGKAVKILKDRLTKAP